MVLALAILRTFENVDSSIGRLARRQGVPGRASMGCERKAARPPPDEPTVVGPRRVPAVLPHPRPSAIVLTRSFAFYHNHQHP
jgi:hypothetical protein